MGGGHHSSSGDPLSRLMLNHDYIVTLNHKILYVLLLSFDIKYLLYKDTYQ